MKRIFALLVLIWGLTAQGAAAREISGTITFAEDNQPAISATIQVLGTTRVTTSDVNGNFKINAENDETLEISCIGFNTQNIRITSFLITPLEIKLQPTTISIDNVVITGLGVRKQTKSLGCAASAMQGKVSGVVRIRNNSRKEYAVDQSYYSSNVQCAPESNEKYAAQKPNSFLTVKDAPMSTFAMEVDVASYTNCKRLIEQGTLPTPDAVRVEEFLNYFSYDLPQPTGVDPIKISTELAACPWNPAHKLIRIGVKARQLNTDAIPNSNFVFLVDVSGSMYRQLELVKSSLKMLINNLRPTDKVAIVVYAGAAGTVLESTPGTNKQKILEALQSLTSGGSTAGGAGIKLAYSVAKKNFIKDGNNRIILCSDGDFNVGVSSSNELLTLVEGERKTSNIFMTVLGYGQGNYRDDFMQTIAEKGNGNFAYINSMQDANKVLAQEYGSSMYAVAKDVKMQIEFNPAYVREYRLVGYESRLLDDEDFNNDQIDAGEMGAGHAVTALYELVPVGGKSARDVDTLRYQSPAKVQRDAPTVTGTGSEILFVKVRYKAPNSNNSSLITTPVLASSEVKSGSTDFNFASSVAMFAQKLSGSKHQKYVSYDHIIDLAKRSYGDDPYGYRREFVRLAETANGLSK